MKVKRCIVVQTSLANYQLWWWLSDDLGLFCSNRTGHQDNNLKHIRKSVTEWRNQNSRTKSICCKDSVRSKSRPQSISYCDRTFRKTNAQSKMTLQNYTLTTFMHDNLYCSSNTIHFFWNETPHYKLERIIHLYHLHHLNHKLCSCQTSLSILQFCVVSIITFLLWCTGRKAVMSFIYAILPRLPVKALTYLSDLSQMHLKECKYFIRYLTCCRSFLTDYHLLGNFNFTSSVNHLSQVTIYSLQLFPLVSHFFSQKHNRELFLIRR